MCVNLYFTDESLNASQMHFQTPFYKVTRNSHIVIGDGKGRCGGDDTCQWQPRESQNQYTAKGAGFHLDCYCNFKSQ